MQDLLSLCERHDIVVLYRRPLTRSGNYLGYYYTAHDGIPVILLDDKLHSNPRLHRCILAEELGHYACGAAGNVVQLHGPGGLARGRDERRGKDWAANHLIPTPELAAAAKRGIFLPYELADYFFVTEWMVWRKFHLLRRDLREQDKLRVLSGDILSPLLVDVMWGQAV